MSPTDAPNAHPASAAATERPVLRLAHSPDPDDAFMWWPLVAGPHGGPHVDTRGFDFEIVAEDIAELNRRSPSAELEITAMSCGAFPFVADRYAITACGASMGDGYGPKLVAGRPMTVEELRDPEVVIAIPGERTSAMMTTRLLVGPEPGAFRYEEMAFEAIIDAVQSGRCAAGLVIHEAQLTYQDAGLHLVADLGAWWRETRGTLLPLGINAIRRDLEVEHGPGTLTRVTRVLQDALGHALEHRDTSIAVALEYARDMGAELAGEFVDLYVNRHTLAFGPDGEAAVRGWLDAIADAGLAPRVDDLEFIAPE
ncbi:MAG: menaquinone biosynthesis family protein [Phycisphaerales bacterium]